MTTVRRRRQVVSSPSWILEGEENGMRDMTLKFYDEYSAYSAFSELQRQLNDEGWRKMKDSGDEITYCLNGVIRMIKVNEETE